MVVDNTGVLGMFSGPGDCRAPVDLVIKFIIHLSFLLFFVFCWGGGQLKECHQNTTRPWPGIPECIWSFDTAIKLWGDHFNVVKTYLISIQTHCRHKVLHQIFATIRLHRWSLMIDCCDLSTVLLKGETDPTEATDPSSATYGTGNV